jgi:adenylosuccinate synthase
VRDHRIDQATGPAVGVTREQQIDGVRRMLGAESKEKERKMQLNEAQVVALVGAQYGSEGKGVIAAKLAHEFQVHIRTGGPNAGHTFMANGMEFVARGLPVGWINQEAELLIGPGAVVDLRLLDAEITEAEARSGLSVRHRVMIDPKAHVVTAPQHKAEGGVQGEAHHEIGSTGEGVGLCRVAKIGRRSLFGARPGVSPAWSHAVQVGNTDTLGIPVGDTVRHVNWMIDADARVLLEGTQGSGLSLTHGEWPYVTSADTNAATMAADAGIAPHLVQSLLVARTFPIRVHGNSGPMFREVDWGYLGVPPETTTVTKKERRIGQWDWDLIERSVMLNRPLGIALTFLDYWDPEARGAERVEDLAALVRRKIEQIEVSLDVPVLFASTGPAGTPILDLVRNTIDRVVA